MQGTGITIASMEHEGIKTSYYIPYHGQAEYIPAFPVASFFSLVNVIRRCLCLSVLAKCTACMWRCTKGNCALIRETAATSCDATT
ncbi:hypothetical protein BDZ89DRAFT_1060971 [Hymenopellis radicata]|nr:hypothetical protein BDZ89DRAFT_1060971 [Hymenopellis radicata]